MVGGLRGDGVSKARTMDVSVFVRVEIARTAVRVGEEEEPSRLDRRGLGAYDVPGSASSTNASRLRHHQQIVQIWSLVPVLGFQVDFAFIRPVFLESHFARAEP